MKLKILSICGSPRPVSRVRAGLEAIRDAIAARGVENYVWNLGAEPLPFIDPEEQESGQVGDPTLRRFIELARAADGYVLGSPIYHNSYSGWLKNALDHLSMEDMGGKAFALTSNGGRRSPQAVDHLRIVVRSVQGIAIPTQLCTDEEDHTAADGPPRLTAPIMLERANRLAEELVEYTAMLAARRAGALKGVLPRAPAAEMVFACA